MLPNAYNQLPGLGVIAIDTPEQGIPRRTTGTAFRSEELYENRSSLGSMRREVCCKDESLLHREPLAIGLSMRRTVGARVATFLRERFIGRVPKKRFRLL